MSYFLAIHKRLLNKGSIVIKTKENQRRKFNIKAKKFVVASLGGT